MMVRVFEVKGAAGTIDGVEQAFNNRVEVLSQDPRIGAIKAEVLTDGEREDILGTRINITGYTIDVEYLDAATR